MTGQHSLQVGAVVVGLDRHISYYKLQYAVTCLLENDGCVFVACNTDARGNLTSAREWCGAGTMVAAVRGRLGVGRCSLARQATAACCRTLLRSASDV